MQNIIKHDKNEYNSANLIIIIFIIALGFRLFTLFNYGNDLKVLMDDRHYVYGAIQFLKNGHIVGNMVSEPTIISMPGTFMWLAALMKIFGYTQTGLILIRACFCIMDCITLIGIYKFVKKILSEKVALIAAIFYAVGIPFVCVSNLFMSEPITVFGIVWFLYYAVIYCETRKDKYFLLLFLFYFIALLQRTTVAFIPVVVLVYYIKKGFPIKLILTRCLYAGILVSVLLSPWWYRNYLATGEFIPTTVGGDAFLGGTYYFDSLEMEDELTFDEARIAFTNPSDINPTYMRMQREEEYAKERIGAMWQQNKIELLKTYLIEKPYYSWYGTTRYGLIYDISSATLDQVHRICLCLAGFGVLIGLYKKELRLGTIICMSVMIYYTIFTAIFLPFAGYNFPAYFAMLALAAIPIQIAADFIINGYSRLKIFKVENQ